MAIRGRNQQVDGVQGRENETSDGLLVFRQSDWGKINGETTLSVYSWDAINLSRLGKPSSVVAFDYNSLMRLASAVLRMAGHKGAARAIIKELDTK